MIVWLVSKVIDLGTEPVQAYFTEERARAECRRMSDEVLAERARELMEIDFSEQEAYEAAKRYDYFEVTSVEVTE